MASENEQEQPETKKRGSISPQSEIAFAKEVTRSTKMMLDKEKKVKTRLQRQTDAKATNFETVCLNGYLYKIKKGVDVELPETIYEILREANMI